MQAISSLIRSGNRAPSLIGLQLLQQSNTISICRALNTRTAGMAGFPPPRDGRYVSSFEAV